MTKIPGYEVVETLYEDTSKFATIIRARSSTQLNGSTVICKGHTILNDNLSAQIEYEFNILNSIRSEVMNNKKPAIEKPSQKLHIAPGARLNLPTDGDGSRPSTSIGRKVSNIKSNKGYFNQLLTAGRVPKSIDCIHNQDDGVTFLVMEDFGGITMRNFIKCFVSSVGDNPNFKDTDLAKKSKRLIPLDFIINLALQLSEALEIIHACRIVHMDISPDNILVKYGSSNSNSKIVDIQLIDFGIAKMIDDTILNQMMGCVKYMPPGIIHSNSGC
jgi:serine/threonine protein kinase